MPKVTLEFNLPDEKAEYEIAIKAGSYYSVLWDMQEYFMRKYKHKEVPSKQASKEFYENREYFFNLMSEEEINL